MGGIIYLGVKMRVFRDFAGYKIRFNDYDWDSVLKNYAD